MTLLDDLITTFPEFKFQITESLDDAEIEKLGKKRVYKFLFEQRRIQDAELLNQEIYYNLAFSQPLFGGRAAIENLDTLDDTYLG